MTTFTTAAVNQLIQCAYEEGRKEAAPQNYRFMISVRPTGHPILTYHCKNAEEAAALTDAFSNAVCYLGVPSTFVECTIVDREEVAKEFVEHDPV